MNCFHCRTEIPEDIKIHTTINNNVENFCCFGCKTVAEIIVQSGKSQFYSLRGASELDPVQQDYQIDVNLDNELTYTEYVLGDDPTNREVFVSITNIHCSACVWLNEKVLSETAGIHSVQINFASARAHIIWDDTVLKLSDIFRIIFGIGYKPVLYAPWKKETKIKEVTTDLLYRLGIAGFCFGNIMLFSVALYSGYFSGIEMEYKKLLHYVSWILATPVYLYSGIPFFRGAFYGLKHKSLSMDALLVLGISMAYFYSIYVTITDRGEVYFDSVCMIYFFILIGKYFEAASRTVATRKIGILLSKLPEISIIVESDGTEKEIPSYMVKKDSIVKILPGARVPVDGVLLSEDVYVDESFLTGEPEPIRKKKNEILYAGSLTIDKMIHIQAMSKANDSTLSRIQNMIEKALTEKPNIQRITDRIATYFIRVVLLFAIVTFVGWFFYVGDLEKAVIYTIAVLIVACPCALGLSVPAALVMNNLINSEKGIILKNPDIIDPLSKSKTLILDKTGTITTGRLSVTEELLEDQEFTRLLAYFVEQHSKHPIARSMKEYLSKYVSSQLDNEKSENVLIKEYAGSGIEGQLIYKQISYTIKLGTLDFVSPNQAIPVLPSKRGTSIYISINDVYKGYWTLQDTIRPNTKEEILKLKSIMSSIKVLSGDQEDNVKAVCNELGIDSYRFRMKPLDKINEIKQLQESGETVVMVGDGINDAGVLARSNVGISLEMAADISIDKSDIVLLKNDFQGIRFTIQYAKLTNQVIYQNIIISFIYNSVMLPLAMLGLMAPVYCAVFMTLSSITVVTNSLFLKYRARRLK